MAEEKVGTVEPLSQAQADIFDVSQRADVPQLRKHAVGLWGVLFLTVTGSAPISAMLFNTPLAVGFGNGLGAPAAFLFATVILTIFSVGYVAMSRKVTTAGGFYSYISHGLGRELGLGTGFGAVVAYSVFEASLAGGFAFFLNQKLSQIGTATGAGWLNGIQWPYLALLMVVLISLITYFDIRITARVLGVFLVGEILFLLIFDVAMIVRGATTSTAFTLEALNPVKAFQGFPAVGTLAAGIPAIGLFFAFWSWVGFEMAPNYGEESVNPKRVVPQAMYISVVGLGIFYILTSWAPFAGYATLKDVIAQAQGNAAQFYLGPAQQYIGLGVDQALSILIITGSFACGMAFHNTACRYFYSLGREKVLPAALGRTHPRWKSPHIASITQSVIAAVILGRDPALLPAAPRERGPLVEHDRGADHLVHRSGVGAVPAVHQHRLRQRRPRVRALARPDRSRHHRGGHRPRVLSQEQPAREVQDPWPSHPRKPLVRTALPAGRLPAAARLDYCTWSRPYVGSTAWCAWPARTAASAAA